MTDLLLYLNLGPESGDPYSSMKDFNAVGISSECVSATACSVVVSEFPSDAGLGFFLCIKISGLGMIEPDASCPRVTLTFEPSSKYRQDTLTGALVTGSIKLTLEYDMGDSTLTSPPGFSCVFLTARLFYRHNASYNNISKTHSRLNVNIPNSSLPQ